MTSGISGITSKAVEFALDGMALRQEAIASNIANYNSIGYKPIKVSFESAISDMLSNQNSIGSTSDGMSETKFSPNISYGSPIVGNTYGTGLDANLVMLNQNNIQYQALIKGFDKYASTIAQAIKEGRR